MANMFSLVAAPRASLAGLQSTVTALPCTNYKIEVLDSLLSVLINILLLVLMLSYCNNGATLQPTTWPAQPPAKLAAM